MKSVCIYCGSNSGARPVYLDAAKALGYCIAERGLTLVYGGATVGLMGAVADAALEAGGSVIGVMPHALVAKEISHSGLTELIEVATMHERKAVFADLADGFIALPGGAGTLDETFEVWTWAQLGEHDNPIGLLNVAGYYDLLLSFFDHQANERFMRQEHRDMIIVEDDPGILLDRFVAYAPPVVEKWISPQER